VSRNERRFPGRPRRATSWDHLAAWYDGWVGERGSQYHRAVAIPATLELLDPQPNEEVLDVGAGQGVLAPYLVKRGARYTGVDASPRLVARARKRHGHLGRFLVGDALTLDTLPGSPNDGYDAAVFLLSLQDIDPFEEAIASVARVLKPSSRIVILLTHPAFRQPRHSGWGYDAARKLTFRRVDAYLTPMKVPMKALAGHRPTVSFHRPLSSYINAIGAAGFAVDAMRELPDLAQQLRPRREQRHSGNLDIPLFLGLRAIR
jgi:ubiquinone/menaquinone biosynthesis C-methylase UbiE